MLPCVRALTGDAREKYTDTMGRTVVFGDFEWDEDKAQQNIRKYGISFEEATQIFADPYFFEVLDDKHSTADEVRHLGWGRVRGFVVATIVFVKRGRVRLVSARKANKKEEKNYYDQNFEQNFTNKHQKA